MTSEIQAGRVAAGQEALTRCEWSEAQLHFEAALGEDPADPVALDGLAMALFWLGDLRTPLELRERAYVEHRRRGHGRGAAAAALFVSGEYRISGENAAAAQGWLARAERCLEGLELCSEHGGIEVERAKATADAEAAEAHAQRALAIAAELGDADLEITALAQLGARLVATGRWEDGMALLDEAMAAALAGEARDALAICDTCCQTLVACEQIADLRRASEWCRVVVEFTQRRRFTPVYAWCRAIYAGVLTAAGEWERAERELMLSLRTYDSRGGIGTRVVTLARLAELRIRQGRLEEAERLLAGSEEHPLALLPVARLRLARDEGGVAAMLERRLSLLPEDSAGRAPLLSVLVDAFLTENELESAVGAAEALAGVAGALRRDNLVGLAELALGDVALARGENALPNFERALELFLELGMPFEEGEARLRLARAFAASGSPLAAREAEPALAIFERLGAARKADETAALLRTLGASGRTRTKGKAELTQREHEVLHLLAEGLSNAEIAQRLVISQKTAGHHVSRIFRKLGLRNRAEAAAYVLREALDTSGPS